MSEDRCVHDMLPGQCADCTGRDGGEQAERARIARIARISRLPGVIEARWPGVCASCGERFAAGDPIRAQSQRGDWISTCCIS